MRIQKLKDEIINQIAAGEVLERPANLLKELLENSIDAGADQIEIEVSEGGRYLMIRDNGMGIEKDDLGLALQRHATSKIQDTSDLWELSSYGFRGEALASIAAVSKMQIRSRAIDSEQAYAISSDFGSISAILPVSLEQGTQIQVEQLFENLPARLKFLKSESAELSQIKKVLKAVALSRPSISFRMSTQGKTILEWPKANTSLIRAQQVLGVKKLYQASGEQGLLKIEAFYSAPNETQRSSQNMWFFVQDRWIQDKSLLSAVLAGYESLLMHGEYPSLALFVSAHPQEVDVNIHPSKSQVRFRDPSSVFRAVRSTLKESLSSAPWLENLQAAKLEIQESFEKPHYKPESNLEFSAPSFQNVQFQQKQWSEPQSFQVESPKVSLASKAANLGEPFYWSNLQVLGQCNQTYIICQSQNSLILIDQHAAHERVVYEQLMCSWEGNQIETQNFLLPIDIELSVDRIEALLSQKQDLQQMGIEVEQSGPQHIRVTRAPIVLKEKSLNLALHDLADECLKNSGGRAVHRLIQHFCATLACHSVIRAGQALSLEEMQSLLQQMDEFRYSSFCPHGRPVYVEYPFSKLDREFGRIL